MIDGWRGRRRGRSRGRETECFHLVGNPVRLPPPDGTHWSPSPTPQPAVSAASSDCERVKAREREREETLACVCVCPCLWDESAVDEPQTDRHDPPHLTSPALPRVQGAHPGCSVQDDPLRGGDSWWRLQPSRAAIGHREDGAECKLSIQFKEKKKNAHTNNQN